ncbi:hypothetical protein MMC11_001917 [Xylographa trunciseda]|nr:hypothetical protein [Xylographa trunciseda]
MKPTEAYTAQTQDTEPSHDGLHKLLNNSDYSDFTVKCGAKTWRIHRAIVCSRSKYFKKVCDGDFKVRLSPPVVSASKIVPKEAREAILTLEDEDPDLIEEMLVYLYTMQYPQTPSGLRKAKDMVLDAKMYGIADKYDLPDMKQKVLKAFEPLLALYPSDPLFTEAATYVYRMTIDTDRGLRDLVKGLVWGNRTTMITRKDVQECIMHNEGFKDDVMHALFADPGAVGTKKEKKERGKRLSG